MGILRQQDPEACFVAVPPTITGRPGKRHTALAVDVIQPSLLMRVQLGDSVTLTCFCPDDVTYLTWFRQAVGQKPQLMARTVTLFSVEFDKKYKNIKRYSLQNAKGSFNLTISNAEPSDSAVYYCAAVFLHEVTFGNGTFVIITGKNSNSRTVVQQPVSDTVQPGDSVDLQCTIETGSCAGEHSVYWFRHGSGESLPGVIYSHRNRSDTCEKSPEAGSPTRSCVYILPKRNLSLSDAGTYYCAVAMCGEMLFGNGTQLDVDVKALRPVWICLPRRRHLTVDAEQAGSGEVIPGER
ncbi:uncharacterized protein [Paramormyrops kingsleyae]|uniref:uncharacterized protein n=1 Tax=Paramormyrops kingsleyae TaxID=1676925 RepID=UPI003B972ACD